MTDTYEKEQFELRTKSNELKNTIDEAHEISNNASSFLGLVKKHTEIKELDAEIIRTFIKKVYVYSPEKVNGKRQQKLKIIFNCIGEFNLPVNEKKA